MWYINDGMVFGRKKNEVLMHAATLMELESMLSERKQS